MSSIPVLLVPILWVGTVQAVPCQNEIPASNPNEVYIEHDDGTVTDMRTGLMWRQCAEGLSGASCQEGFAQTLGWANALAHADASTFGGYPDWRLPNIKELSSLLEGCRSAPAINTNLFPNTPRQTFASSSPGRSPGNILAANFHAGFVFNAGMDSFLSVRLVRDQGLIGDRYEAIGANDAIIRDLRTGLVWKRCSEGQEWNKISNSCDGEPLSVFWQEAVETYGTWDDVTTWPDALLSGMKLPLPTGEWRLPTIEQLGSLLYCSNGNPEAFDPHQPCQGLDFTRPTINLQAFPNSPAFDVWSGSSGWGGLEGIDEFNAWRAHFWSGYVTANFAGGSANPIRLMHDPNR